jgi:3-hydroxyacyl-[acyl-carrier-protein] dehydratase
VNRATPLNAVDEAEVTPGVGVVARKFIRADDPYLSGHYPDFTIYPGVFAIESASQAVDRYVTRTHGPAYQARLVAVDTVRFSAPLRPGDTLWLHIDCASDGDVLLARVRCHDGADRPTARMALRFQLSEVSDDHD